MRPHRILLLLALAAIAGFGCEAKTGSAASDAAGVVDSGAGIDSGELENCNFVTCDGCCDGNVCINNVDEANCGQAGSACHPCGNSDICVAGSCVLPTTDCTNCTGCCFGGTQCLEGNTKSACGDNGDSCIACADGQGCNAGVCETNVCDGTNCDGCCTVNGECILFGQQDESVCGKNAAACEVCDASAVDCTAGTCVIDQPCLDVCEDGCCTGTGQCILFADQDTDNCGDNETCSACGGGLSCIGGACTADPVWTIVVKSAIVADTDYSGGDWDQIIFSSPLPDPYVGGNLIGDNFVDWYTETIDNTLTPFWNEAQDSYLQSDLIATGMVFGIYDDDNFPAFEFISSCNVTILQTDLDAGTLTKAVCGAKVTDLVIDFVQN